MKNKQLFKNKW